MMLLLMELMRLLRFLALGLIRGNLGHSPVRVVVLLAMLVAEAMLGLGVLVKFSRGADTSQFRGIP